MILVLPGGPLDGATHDTQGEMPVPLEIVLRYGVPPAQTAAICAAEWFSELTPTVLAERRYRYVGESESSDTIKQQHAQILRLIEENAALHAAKQKLAERLAIAKAKRT